MVNPRGIAVALTNLGNLYRRSGRFGKAEGCYGEALVLHERVGNRRGAAAARCNLALNLLAQGREPEARREWELGAQGLGAFGDANLLRDYGTEMRARCSGAGVRPLDEP